MIGKIDISKKIKKLNLVIDKEKNIWYINGALVKKCWKSIIFIEFSVKLHFKIKNVKKTKKLKKVVDNGKWTCYIILWAFVWTKITKFSIIYKVVKNGW